MLSAVILCVVMLSAIKLSVIILNVVMLTVIVLNVVTLSAEAPFQLETYLHKRPKVDLPSLAFSPKTSPM